LSQDEVAQRAEKQVSDRTSVLIAGNSFLFGAFATLLNSAYITRWLSAIPLIFCGLGIVINVLLGYTNVLQMGQINTYKMDLTTPSLYKPEATRKKLGIVSAESKPKPDYFKLFNQYGPFALIAAWGLCLVFFAIQVGTSIL
jgi:hypothetical protein